MKIEGVVIRHGLSTTSPLAFGGEKHHSFDWISQKFHGTNNLVSSRPVDNTNVKQIWQVGSTFRIVFFVYSLSETERFSSRGQSRRETKLNKVKELNSKTKRIIPEVFFSRKKKCSKILRQKWTFFYYSQQDPSVAVEFTTTVRGKNIDKK